MGNQPTDISGDTTLKEVGVLLDTCIDEFRGFRKNVKKLKNEEKIWESKRFVMSPKSKDGDIKPVKVLEGGNKISFDDEVIEVVEIVEVKEVDDNDELLL